MTGQCYPIKEIAHKTGQFPSIQSVNIPEAAGVFFFWILKLGSLELEQEQHR